MKEEKTAISKNWPGAFGVYKTSKEAIMLNISSILVLIAISIVASIILNIIFGNDNFSGIASFLLAPFFTVVMYYSVFKKKIESGQIVDKTSPHYVQLLFLSILIYLSLVFSLLLFIIPFFFVMPRLVLAPYYLVHKNLSAMDAFKMSWEKSQPHQGKVWGIIGATIVMALPALTIIGIPFAIYFVFMYSAAVAVLFKFVSGTK